MHRHGAIALVRAMNVERCIDGDLLIVDAQTMALRVSVGKEAGL